MKEGKHDGKNRKTKEERTVDNKHIKEEKNAEKEDLQDYTKSPRRF